MSHLVDIIDVLKKCGFPEAKWFDLGLRLGLLHNALTAIEANYGLVDRCLMECLSKWLSRADNVVSRGGGPPSWDSLSDALRAMNEIAVADKLDQHSKSYHYMCVLSVCSIERPHAVAIGILTNHHAVLTSSLSDTISVARLLNDERVLSDKALSSVVSTRGSTERRKVLLAAVREAVQTNYYYLQTFATVLSRFTGNIRLGEIIHRDYGKN